MAIKIGDMVARVSQVNLDGTKSYTIGIVTDIVQMGSGLSNAKGNTYHTVEWSHESIEPSFINTFEVLQCKMLFDELKKDGVI